MEIVQAFFQIMTELLLQYWEVKNALSCLFPLITTLSFYAGLDEATTTSNVGGPIVGGGGGGGGGGHMPPVYVAHRSNSSTASSSPPSASGGGGGPGSDGNGSASGGLVVPQPINAAAAHAAAAAAKANGTSGRKYQCKMCPQVGKVGECSISWIFFEGLQKSWFTLKDLRKPDYFIKIIKCCLW